MITFNEFVLYLFFIFTLLIGYYSGRSIKTIREFSISHKSYSTPVLVATIFATVIGGGSTFGVIEKTYTTGFIYTFVFMGMAFNRILVGHFLSTRVTSLNGVYFTLPSLMKEHYGIWGSRMTALCTLLVSIASVGTQTFTIGFLLNSFFGFPHELSVWLGCGILILYSSFGGMRSVIATDVFQFFFIMILIPLLLTALMPQVGGAQVIAKGISNHFLPADGAMLKYAGLFLSFLFGAADPSFLQRLLVAKDHKQAKRATLLTGYLSIFFYMMMGIMGIMAFLLYPGLEGRAAFIKLVELSFSPLLQATVVCGLLAAVMSTADSDLNMVGISVAQDLLPHLSENNKLKIARLSTFILGLGAVYVALKFTNVLDIIMYAFSFWAPSVLIPLIGCFLRYVVPTPWMISGVLLGFAVTQGWNNWIEPIIPLEGIVPGMLIHAFFFTIKAKKI